jgi:hypothetical protein
LTRTNYAWLLQRWHLGLPERHFCIIVYCGNCYISLHLVGTVMANTILFERDETGYTTDPLMGRIREVARKEKWAGQQGFKQWAKETYNATLRAGIYDDWTSITFKTEQDLNRFKQDFGVE